MILQQDKHIHKNYLCDVRERREAEGGEIISDCPRTLQGGTYTCLPHLVRGCVCGWGKGVESIFSTRLRQQSLGMMPRPRCMRRTRTLKRGTFVSFCFSRAKRISNAKV